MAVANSMALAAILMAAALPLVASAQPDAQAPVLSLSAGSGVQGSLDGPPGVGQLGATVYGAFYDTLSGDVILATGGDYTVRRVAQATGAVTTWLGKHQTSGYSNLAGTAARFRTLWDAVVDQDTGFTYIADDNNVVRKATSDGTVSTWVTSVNEPTGLAIYDGYVWICALGAAAVYKGQLSNAAKTTFVSGAANHLKNAFTQGGTMYVSTHTEDTVVKYVPPSTTKIAVVGTANANAFGNGAGASAKFHDVFSLSVDSNDYVFVADNGNSKVRVISPTDIVSTLSLPMTPAGVMAVNVGPSDTLIVSGGSDFYLHIFDPAPRLPALSHSIGDGTAGRPGGYPRHPPARPGPAPV